DNITDAAVADRYRTEQKIGSDLGFTGAMQSAGGGNVAFRGGQVEGAVQAANVEAESANYDKMGSIHSGAAKQASKKLNSMAAYGDNISAPDANYAGTLEGIKSAHSDIGNVKAVKNDVNGMKHFKEGAEMSARMQTNKMMGVGMYFDGK
ncbi:hypothetical protein, partial [Sulfurimonas indica]|uniref:hypothetical protein n=1 Tax=Sulfurimonas indica TaxID=2508707 RepID=UPI00165F057C